MYAVYVDNEILYSPLLIPEDGRYALLSAKITKEPGKAGSFKFTLPPNSIMYDDIKKLKSMVRIVNGDITEYKNHNGEKFSASTQTQIPLTVLYKTVLVNQGTGEITLAEALNADGSKESEQYEKVNEYKYFYGDRKDGTQDHTVYMYSYIKRSVSSGMYPIIFYSYLYYKQEVYKTVVEKEIFRGRVINTEKEFYNRKSIVCEGELAFLLDSIQRPYLFQGNIPALFKQFISNHNKDVDSDKQFQVGNVTVTDSNDYIRRETNEYPKTLDEMKKKLVDTHGGYFKTRLSGGIRYVDYLEKPGKICTQVIEFGKNLLDITEYIDAKNVCTVLIPLGEKLKDETGNETGERLTIESVNKNKDYIESELGITLFGRIVRTKEWDDVTLSENLLKKGKEYLNKSIEMAISIRVKAVDMSLADINAEEIKEGDEVRVISPPHNIDSFFMCSKVELDILNPGNSVYEFGVSFTSLTGKLTKG